MTTNYGGLILPDPDDPVTSASVTANFVKVLKNQEGAVAPASPVTGQTWFDTGTNVLRVWNGSVWNTISGGGGGGIGASDSAAMEAGAGGGEVSFEVKNIH